MKRANDMLQRAKLFTMAAWLLMFLANVPWAVGEDHPQVPLLEDGDMIQVPVQAFGKTLYFIVDTGFAVSAIDAQYEPYLGEQIDTYTAVSPLGTKKDVAIFQCPDISLAGEPLALNEIVGLDLQMMSRITGRPCDGVLGMDWFEKNIVSIDFDHKTFTLDPEIPTIVSNTFVPVQLEESNRYYFMKAVVNGGKNLNLMIDTGDSGSVSLNQTAWRDVFSTNEMKTAAATVADAVNRVAQTRIGVLGQVAVQVLTYTNLHATLIQNTDQPSRLGLRFFQRHNVTFDFAGRMLYLQPGQQYTAADVEDMSGLHLLRIGGATTVYSVDEASPAAAQGVLANDIIERVNDQPAASLSLQAIREILRSADGARVSLQLRRGDRQLDAGLVLKQTI
jgi:hypothetical protein